MIHLQLPDGKVFQVERKGNQLTYQQGRIQHNQPTFAIYWQMWLKNQIHADRKIR